MKQAFWIALVFAAASAGSVFAQPAAPAEKKIGWAGTAELTVVAAGGNSEAQTFGFRGTAERSWIDARLLLESGALRAEQTKTTRRAIGPPSGPITILEDDSTETTAENYFLRGRYDHDLVGRLFAFGGAGWDRNELAGIENRYSIAAGAGHAWSDTDVLKNRTSYGLTYTLEEETSGLDENFVGLRLSWDFLRKLNPGTTFTSVLILDENLEETSDYRGDLTVSLAATMTQRLALKTSLQILFDNEPAFTEVGREFPAGIPAGDSVLVQLEEIDTLFTAAVVVSF